MGQKEGSGTRNGEKRQKKKLVRRKPMRKTPPGDWGWPGWAVSRQPV